MPRAIPLASLLLVASFGAGAAALEMNGVPLGASERDVKKAFPSAYCKPLEWESRAADRRCDDARASVGGVGGRVTFYLKKDEVQAFDLRFESKHFPRLMKMLRERYGEPSSETKEPGKDGEPIYKARWERGRDKAVLVAPMDTRRAQLSVSRGRFEEEIYRVR